VKSHLDGRMYTDLPTISWVKRAVSERPLTANPVTKKKDTCKQNKVYQKGAKTTTK